ncbi:MAG: glycine cleavage system protein GcvH [Desulfovibrio desulfuricans]|jgi:glycine cleavage system H protein|uniref:glycine cleavage system protein GcvH n=1 Tax=uncultured Desulfovibrio sp. TaxID=167968 RepID=UPI001B0D574A|nr:glycine cleavage system protein GcvH [uncultured Desulfovibrio sp.]MBE6442119.1 glycine cleavage system protein GcvH [Desulfovibrio desulfuricans]MBO5490031.1 glycine cleavage system protein GcvH [Desulfovibrio sp.]
MAANPADLLYSKTHEWCRMEGGEAVVGITAFAQESLGDITYVELPAVGDTLEAEKEFGSIESVKAASDLVSPVAGEVVAVNGALEGNPELCNSDPYGKGWLVRVKPAGAPEGLMDATAYEAHCAAER